MARNLRPDLIEVDLVEGQTQLEAGEPEAAIPCLDRLLEREPGNVKGLLARAQANAARQRFREAEADYTAAIAQFQGERTPRPEMYLERAQAQAAQGEAALDAAIRGLDEGIARLGAVVSLELYAIDLLMRKGDAAAALERVRRAALTARNKVSWLVREAEILEAWGRQSEAREAYTRALEALRSAGNRRTPLSVALETRLETAIDRLSGDSQAATTTPAS